MDMKRRVKLNESDIRRIVKESVNKVIMGEAVLPDYSYDEVYNEIDDSGYYDEDGNYFPEYDTFLNKGNDMFPDDVLYKAEMLRKMTGDKFKITIDRRGNFIMNYNGESLSTESLQLIIKVPKYLRTDRVYFNGQQVIWKTNNSYDKSHKTQVGNKFFDNVSKEHQVKKPRVSHEPYKPTPLYQGGYSTEGSGFGTDGIRTY